MELHNAASPVRTWYLLGLTLTASGLTHFVRPLAIFVSFAIC